MYVSTGRECPPGYSRGHENGRRLAGGGGRVPTVEVGPELALEKNGIAVAVVLERLCEKRFEMVADDGVEDGRLGLTAAVA